MKRAAGILLVLAMLALAATGETVYSRPMDRLSVAWFAFLGMLAAIAVALVASTLIMTARRGELRTSFDGFFWALFLVLPIFIWLLGVSVWTLGWYFFGWE